MTLLEKLKRMEEIERVPTLTKQLMREYAEIYLFVETETPPLLTKALEYAEKMSKREDLDLETRFVARAFIYIMETGKEPEGEK